MHSRNEGQPRRRGEIRASRTDIAHRDQHRDGRNHGTKTQPSGQKIDSRHKPAKAADAARRQRNQHRHGSGNIPEAQESSPATNSDRGMTRRGSRISSPMNDPASHPPNAKKIVERKIRFFMPGRGTIALSVKCVADPKR